MKWYGRTMGMLCIMVQTDMATPPLFLRAAAALGSPKEDKPLKRLGRIS